MRYFTKELICTMYDSPESEEKWATNRNEYENMINNTVKPLLSKKFYKDYEECYRFHDWYLKEFHIINNLFRNNEKSNCNLVVTYYNGLDKLAIMTYKGVSTVDISYSLIPVASERSLLLSRFQRVLYDEFNLSAEGGMNHCILLEEFNEISIDFLDTSLKIIKYPSR